MECAMKKLIPCFLALLLLAVPLSAEQVSGNVLLRYDLDATTTTYCVMSGMGGAVLAPPVSGMARIKTSGASTTVVAETASTYPFADLAVGDIIIADGNVRLIMTWTDADTIVVDSNVTLAGNTFAYYKVHCGTAATSGWFSVANFEVIGIKWQPEQWTVTGGVSMRLECAGDGLGEAPTVVFPSCSADVGGCDTYQSYTGTAGVASRDAFNTSVSGYSKCRIGMKIGSADDGGDTGSDQERINIFFSGTR
jgi:hypothetical protein